MLNAQKADHDAAYMKFHTQWLELPGNTPSKLTFQSYVCDKAEFEFLHIIPSFQMDDIDRLYHVISENLEDGEVPQCWLLSATDILDVFAIKLDE